MAQNNLLSHGCVWLYEQLFISILIDIFSVGIRDKNQEEIIKTLEGSVENFVVMQTVAAAEENIILIGWYGTEENVHAERKILLPGPTLFLLKRKN